MNEKSEQKKEMNEEITSQEISHHQTDEAELDRLEANTDEREVEADDSAASKPKKMFGWILTAAIIGLIGIIGFAWMATKKSAVNVSVETGEKKEEDGHSENESGKEVKLDPESLNSAGIKTETVTQRPAIAKLYVTGAVELNPEKTEMATPLVGGRIESVFFGVGDFVQQGAILAIISSPQLAELHGKMNEARTRLNLAQANLARVQKAENRVSILQAKARLDEAETTLRRTKRLIELGAGAGKDLISAETNYKTAKADFDFQSNIGLNKEIQTAKAEVETARIDFAEIQNQLRTLGIAEAKLQASHQTNENNSQVAVRAPLSGVIEKN